VPTTETTTDYSWVKGGTRTTRIRTTRGFTQTVGTTEAPTETPTEAPTEAPVASTAAVAATTTQAAKSKCKYHIDLGFMSFDVKIPFCNDAEIPAVIVANATKECVGKRCVDEMAKVYPRGRFTENDEEHN
jgi:hypothetical protein